VPARSSRRESRRGNSHFPREELEDVARADHFAHAFRERLAFLAGEQATQLVLPRDHLEASLLEHLGAGLDVGGGPGRRGGAGGGDGGSGLGDVGLRVLADHVIRVGRVDVARPRGTGDPLAADQVLVLGSAHRCCPPEGSADANANAGRVARSWIAPARRSTRQTQTSAFAITHATIRRPRIHACRP